MKIVQICLLNEWILVKKLLFPTINVYCWKQALRGLTPKLIKKSVTVSILQVKFGLSEKHTKICAIFLMLTSKPRGRFFFKFCVLLRKSEHLLCYCATDRLHNSIVIISDSILEGQCQEKKCQAIKWLSSVKVW